MVMNVLIYHPVKLPVSHYGGTERALMWLAESLVESGHKVTLFAAPGSNPPDSMDCIVDESEVRKRIKEFDIVHSFSKLPGEWDELTRGKLLFTIQGNGQAGERFHRNTVFVSRNHAERHGATAYVYNGLNPDELKFSDAPRANRYLFLSKTSLKTKNLSGAMRLARKFNQNLWIAGGDRPLSSRIFTGLKGLSGADWKWIGSVDQNSKADFLLQGRAMMFPLLWNEPFGIVMTESLVSGTPVLAHPYGSVPEVLAFAPECLMRSEEDWRKALTGGIPLPSAKKCRDWVFSMFHRDQMRAGYLKLYEQVISGKSLNPTDPVTRVLAGEVG